MTEEEIYQKAIKKTRPGIKIAIFLSFMASILMLASPLYMLSVYDKVLASGSAPTLFWLTLIIGGAYASLGYAESLRSRALIRAAAAFEDELRPSIFSQAINPEGRGGDPSALSDLRTASGFLGSNQMTPFFDAPFAPIFIIAMGLVHPWLGAFGLVSAIIIFCVAFMAEKLTRKASDDAGKAAKIAQHIAQDAARNCDAVHGLGMAARLRKKFLEATGYADFGRIEVTDAASLLQGIAKGLRLFVQSAVLGLGAWLVLQGDLTGGTMIAGSILLGRALAPIEQSIGGWKGYLGYKRSKQNIIKSLAHIRQQKTNKGLPPLEGRVKFENVFWKPEENIDPVLAGINIDVKPGETLFVMGASASGKSSLLRLLMGLERPTAGEIRIDGCESWLWDPEELGRQSGWLPQEVGLLDGSVGENIARFDEQNDQRQITRAGQRAGVHEMILKMPLAYQTPVGGGGLRLSGGQRQRIGLARALYGYPSMIILDEPDAHLDESGRNAIFNALSSAKERGTTLVIAAHDRRWLKLADKLLVLENGRVIKYGQVKIGPEATEARQKGENKIEKKVS